MKFLTSNTRNISPFFVKGLSDEYLKAIVERETKRYKRGTIITIAGSTHRKTGTGKSYTALRIGEQNDKDYTQGASKVVYFLNEFLKVMNLIEEKKRAGQVAVLDEAGSMLSADKWRSVVNKSVSYVAQTFRYTRAVMVLVMPQQNLIDKKVRNLADYHISMDVTLNKNGKRVFRSTAYALHYNEFEDKTVRKTLKMYYAPLNATIPIRNVPITKVKSKALIEEYEEKSMKFKRQIRDLISEDIKSYEKSIAKEFPLSRIPELAEKLSNNEEFLRSIVVRGKSDADLIASALEKEFPEYNFSSRLPNILKKHLDKILRGK